jgi:hypothetical protein
MFRYYEVELGGIAGSAFILKQDEWNLATTKEGVVLEPHWLFLKNTRKFRCRSVTNTLFSTMQKLVGELFLCEHDPE